LLNDFVRLKKKLYKISKRRLTYVEKLEKKKRFFVTWYGSIRGHKSAKSLSGKGLN
jgi:hypothetical protein